MAKKRDILDSQDFYEMMQMYRHAQMKDQTKVVQNFEKVKQWIRDNYKKDEEK